MDKITIFIISGLIVAFLIGGALFKIFDKLESKLLSKCDKKTKTIIHGVLFLIIFWGLKWAGS